MARVVPNIIAEGETPASSSKMNANMSYICGEIDGVETAKVDKTDYEDLDVLAKVKAVDGSGSGLDADLLDGQQASVFAKKTMDATLNANDNMITNIKRVSFNSEYDNGNSGYEKTIDLSAGQHQKITLTLNCSIHFINPAVGLYTLKVIQDDTGGRTIDLYGDFKWEGGDMYPYSTTPNAEDLVYIYYDGSTYYLSLRHYS
jgi:DNA-binding FrmR family transcriptional regulator